MMARFSSSWLRLATVFPLICVACGAASEGITNYKPDREVDYAKSDLTKQSVGEGKIEDVSSVLAKRRRISLEVEKVLLSSQESIQAIQFVDESHGWLVGNDELFETSDGGERWHQVTVPLTPGSIITTTFFMDQLGWVAVDRCRRNEFCDDHHSSLMYTSD